MRFKSHVLIRKFSFHYHGNVGHSEVNFIDTSKSPDLRNSLYGATLFVLFPILAELWLNSSPKSPA